MASLEEIAEEIRNHPKLVAVDDFEVVLQEIRKKVSRFQNGQSTEVFAQDDIWASLRISYQKRPGRSVVERFHVDSKNQLVDEAFNSARSSSGDPWFRLPLWPKSHPQEEMGNQPLPTHESFFSLLPRAPEMVQECFESKSLSTVILRKGETRRPSFDQAYHAYRFSVVDCCGAEASWVSEERARSRPLLEMGEWLCGGVLRAKEGSAWKEGSGQSRRATILLGPHGSRKLIERVAPWFHADRVRRGLSPLDPKEKLFSPMVNLTDDGTAKDSCGYAPCDLEGIPTQLSPVVESGRVVGLVYDSYEATRENRRSTGNYLRMHDEPWPRIHNALWRLEPSQNRSPLSLCKEMARGICIEDFLDLQQDTRNPYRLNVRAVAREIEQGEVGTTRRSVFWTIDLLDVFRRVIGVGNDLTLFSRSAAPSILIDNQPLRIS